MAPCPRPSRRVRIAYAAVFAGCVVVAALAVLQHYGGAPAAARKAIDSFRAPPVASPKGSNLSNPPGFCIHGPRKGYGDIPYQGMGKGVCHKRKRSISNRDVQDEGLFPGNRYDGPYAALPTLICGSSSAVARPLPALAGTNGVRDSGSRQPQ